MNLVDRRTLLRILGAAALAGCGAGAASTSSDAGADAGGDDPDFPDAGGADPVPDPSDDAGPEDAGSLDAGQLDAGADAGAEAGPATTLADMLNGIETFVVLMQENRSFDQIFGALQRDATYPSAAKVDGTTGQETNPQTSGAPIRIYKTDTYTLADPHHSFSDSHKQWDGGKNDGFVIDHEDAGAKAKQAMAYYDRSNLPFYYWLADNFTICDQWHASVMGPTWPNRYYLNAGTSAGMKDNKPLTATPFPTTLWDRLKTANVHGKNYHDGPHTFFASAFVNDIHAGAVDPNASFTDFLSRAQAGTLPPVCFLEPNHGINDDHPAHNLMKGQAFVATIYKALAASPQWKKCLFVIVYDEHGGFYDHVPPPVAHDDDPSFRRFGFRVPAIVIGPTVKKGYVSKTLYDHTSITKTLAQRLGFATDGKRTAAANPLLDVFDVSLASTPRAAPAIPHAAVPMISVQDIREPYVEGQPEMAAMVASGEVPSADSRGYDEQLADFIATAERMGALVVNR